MRAICGAIITAGAMIGLGLAALGIGIRYQNFMATVENQPHHLVYTNAILIAMAILIAGVVIGLGIATVGLMFHHERRHREWLREQRDTMTPRTPV